VRNTEEALDRRDGDPMKEFEQVRIAAPLCTGYLVDRLALSRIDETDALDIGLRWGPGEWPVPGE
jgi:hypothetical protein